MGAQTFIRVRGRSFGRRQHAESVDSWGNFGTDHSDTDAKVNPLMKPGIATYMWLKFEYSTTLFKLVGFILLGYECLPGSSLKTCA